MVVVLLTRSLRRNSIQPCMDRFLGPWRSPLGTTALLRMDRSLGSWRILRGRIDQPRTVRFLGPWRSPLGTTALLSMDRSLVSFWIPRGSIDPQCTMFLLLHLRDSTYPLHIASKKFAKLCDNLRLHVSEPRFSMLNMQFSDHPNSFQRGTYHTPHLFCDTVRPDIRVSVLPGNCHFQNMHTDRPPRCQHKS